MDEEGKQDGWRDRNKGGGLRRRGRGRRNEELQWGGRKNGQS